MRSLGSRSAVVVIVFGSLLAARAYAQEAPPEGPVPAPPALRPPLPAPPILQQPMAIQPPSYEVHLAMLQILAAGATPIIASKVIFGADSQPAAWIVAVATPFVLGGAVCAIGSASETYEGNCGVAIASGFLGAVSTLPLIAVGAYIGGLGGALALGGVGWFVIQPVAALIGWHQGKKPRPPAIPIQALDRPLPVEPARGRAVLPGQLTVPFLSLAF